MTERFTCQIQFARHDPGFAEDLGSIDASEFRETFRGVDWSIEADRLAFVGKAWPGICVTNTESGMKLWMAAYRALPPDFLDKDEFSEMMAIWYVMKVENAIAVPNVANILDGCDLASAHFETWEIEAVEELFDLFFCEDLENLYSRLFKMERANFA